MDKEEVQSVLAKENEMLKARAEWKGRVGGEAGEVEQVHLMKAFDSQAGGFALVHQAPSNDSPALPVLLCVC